MCCGYFDDAAMEYVITEPRTPAVWINYVGTLAFGGYEDHTGGALLCRGDPTENRVTKYIPQLPAGDFKGTTIYIRVRRHDRQVVFSPFFVPTLSPLDSFMCRVGLGYNRWHVKAYGVEIEVTAFVPADGTPVELRMVTVTNTGDCVCDVDVVPVVEFSHPKALMQLTNADWVPQTMQARAVTSGRQRFIIQYPFMHRNKQVNFLASSVAFSSFETSRRQFLGAWEYATWADPGALVLPELSCSEANRGNVIGALMVHLGTLRSGQGAGTVIMLGQEDSVEAAAAIVARFSSEGEAGRALDKLIADWRDYVGVVNVQTPDKDFDRMLNTYLPRQCRVTTQWSRYLSTYQLGLGSRGIGIRDRSQDLMGTVCHAASEVRGMLLELLTMQRSDGSAVHQFNPLTREHSSGDAAEHPDRPQYYGDDHLWLVLATCAYVEETLDHGVLDELVPFVDSAGEQATVMEHLRRALSFTDSHRGKHGLPLLGFADWNDTVNLPLGAESVFNACLYGTALRRMAELYRWRHMEDAAQECDQRWEEMRRLVHEHCWDGQWYVRYFDHHGMPIGTHRNHYARIYLNAQTWPVIAGFASPERAAAAMESAHRLLNTEFGLKLVAPSYNGFDPTVGGITTYPPGAKENGGIFVHTNPWAIIAAVLIGDGERAFQYFQQVNPSLRNETIERFECEPYVYPQNVLGDEHPEHGAARNSWLTGAASWMYQAALGWILGVRASYEGLVIDPCVPRTWRSFTVRRRFRGCTYNIEVQNSEAVNRGVREIRVDGNRVKGQVVAPVTGRSTCCVEVFMGHSSSHSAV